VIREVSYIRYILSSNKFEAKIDIVAEETPLHILINDEHYVTILCSPEMMKELAIGYLLSEGIIKSVDETKVKLDEDGKCWVRLKPEIDVKKLILYAQPFARLIVSSCGSSDYWPLPKLIDRLKLPKVPFFSKIKAETILESVKHLNNLQGIFKKTGGVHIAALYYANGKKIVHAEDVGRHNAVDKVIGVGALRNIDFKNCFLTLSGRLSGDIVLKAARMKIPLIASITAALNSGVETAKLTELTLVGFVRGKRLNVYTHPKRVVL
jgi:FdhD protein